MATTNPPDPPPPPNDATPKDDIKDPKDFTTEEKPIHCTKPEEVLASTTMAKTLTISDQHATILLTCSPPAAAPEEKEGKKEEEEIKSLLKLTLVPFHKSSLAFVPKDTTTTDNDDDTKEDKKKLKEAEKEHSNNVLTFLSQFDFKMTSESGAEYSFHEAFLKSDEKEEEDADADAPLAKKFKAAVTTTDATVDASKATPPPTSNKKHASFKVELISPASPRQILRALPSPGLTLITETPTLYTTVTKPFINSIVSSGSLSWLENVVSGQKEKERLLHNGKDWILNIDTKWRTHPDAFTTPREQWLKHESVVDLYCLGIIKTKNVATLRDLRSTHLPTLKEMLEIGPQVIEKLYGIPKNQLKIFVHYQPQFYHFHVHYTRLENDVGSGVEKAHLLGDVIQNLEMDGEYYVKRSMTFKLSLKDRLYKLFAAAAAEEKEKGGEERKKDVEMKDVDDEKGTKEEEDTKKDGDDDAAKKDADVDKKEPKEEEDKAGEKAKEEAASSATKTSS